ncbi:hypothetical protein EA58_03975 [Photobacterium galatheae]|uniref:Uncharacterized protein n=2 Tax=Photobacterium galatheae TaxID=1654360 RepID=A0A066RZ01_9GAMM|nr:hypothetical protein EA58_03975 [Photobacterium galatheae]
MLGLGTGFALANDTTTLNNQDHSVVLDLRRDVAWTDNAFWLMTQADNIQPFITLFEHRNSVVPLQILTHDTVPHWCELANDPEVCDDAGIPGSWEQQADPLLCLTLSDYPTLASRLPETETLCLKFSGDFDYPEGQPEPDLFASYTATIGNIQRSQNETQVADLPVRLSLKHTRSLARLSHRCFGETCVGDLSAPKQNSMQKNVQKHSSSTTTQPQQWQWLSGDTSCGYLRHPDWPEGMTAMQHNGRIVRFDVSGSSPALTESGVGLGDSAAAVKSRYEQPLVSQEHEYLGAFGGYLTAWSERDDSPEQYSEKDSEHDSKHSSEHDSEKGSEKNAAGIRFVYNNEAGVTEIYAGNRAILLVEGCH